MTKLSDLEKGIPAFRMEHYGAANGGHVCLVSCLVERDVTEVQDFCDNHTGMSGWLMELNFPEFKDGKYYWRTIRNYNLFTTPLQNISI